MGMRLRSGFSIFRRTPSRTSDAEEDQTPEVVPAESQLDNSRIPEADLDAADEDIFHDTLTDAQQLNAAYTSQLQDQPSDDEPPQDESSPDEHEDSEDSEVQLNTGTQPQFSQDRQPSVTLPSSRSTR